MSIIINDDLFYYYLINYLFKNRLDELSIKIKLYTFLTIIILKLAAMYSFKTSLENNLLLRAYTLKYSYEESRNI